MTILHFTYWAGLTPSVGAFLERNYILTRYSKRVQLPPRPQT